MAENNRDLEKLKLEADNLGIKYSGNIGYESLEKKVKGAKAEKAAAKEKPPRKLTDAQVARMKATSLSKVRIVNLDKENAGATTVFSGVHNMHLDLARVVPLNMDIALEEALIKDIENRRTLSSEPILNKQGEKTGNFKVVEVPAYAVTRLK